MRSRSARIGGSKTLAALMIGGAALAVGCGAGVAGAASDPDVTGQKYSDAQSTINDAGLTAVVSTTVGDRDAWPDCIVTNEVPRTEAAAPDSSGSSTNELLVSLNCDAQPASATKPGFSAASPEGKTLKAAEQQSSGGSSS